MYQNDIDELKEDVERAFKAAISSMDYSILRCILDNSRKARSAYEQKDYQTALYFTNIGYWDIGVCIQRKISNHRSIMPDFFDKISYNILHHFNLQSSKAFTHENLQRCFKLVELTNKSWFDVMARQNSWDKFAEAIDQSNSFEEIKYYFAGILK